MDLENGRRQPSAESAEQVAKLRTRLQELERALREAEKQIDDLETKKESWREEVGSHNYSSATAEFHLNSLIGTPSFYNYFHMTQTESLCSF